MVSMVPGTRRKWQIGMGIAGLVLFLQGVGAAQVTIAPELFGLVSTTGIVFAALPAFLGVLRAYGVRSALPLLVGFGVYALVIESVGVLTGFPYGAFEYRGAMPGEVFGLVPWSVPFAWVPLVVAARAVAERTSVSEGYRWLIALLLLVGFDLVFDPGAVALGIWSYKAGGWYYGVPWTNFFGWVLTGGIAFAVWPKMHTNVPIYTALGPGLMLLFWMGVAAGEGLLLPLVVGVGIGSVAFRALRRTPAALRSILPVFSS